MVDHLARRSSYPLATLAAATLLIGLTGCERRSYEPKPPAATPALPPTKPGATAPTASTPAPTGPATAAPAGRPGTIADLGPISGPGDPANTLRIAGLSAPRTVEWIWVQPSNSFRHLQYTVPAPNGAGDSAEVIISAFLGDDGGPLEQNIDRWVRSFRTDDGEPVEPILGERTVDEMKVTLVEVRGTHRDMTGGQRSGLAQLGAIVDAPGGRVYLRLIGPESTVEASRPAWDALIDGLRKDGASGS